MLVPILSAIKIWCEHHTTFYYITVLQIRTYVNSKYVQTMGLKSLFGALWAGTCYRKGRKSYLCLWWSHIFEVGKTMKLKPRCKICFLLSKDSSTASIAWFKTHESCTDDKLHYYHWEDSELFSPEYKKRVLLEINPLHLTRIKISDWNRTGVSSCNRWCPRLLEHLRNVSINNSKKVRFPTFLW
jgi:hypothetical protein